MVNTAYYVGRSFNCGKNIHVLIGEVEALARQNGNNFGSDSYGKLIHSPLLQFFLTPIYNTLHALEGEKDNSSEEEQISPLDKVQLRNNEDILKAAIEIGPGSFFHTVMYYQTVESFLFRRMDCALESTNLYYERFLVSIHVHIIHSFQYS